MPKSSEPIVVKKYANRRLYNTDTSTYVTLDDLAELVKREDDFVVYDAKTSEDITRTVLTQIIFEQEGKGEKLLPVAFLRQLIRFYDDSLKSLVPSYLEHSLGLFTKDQGRLREQMSQMFTPPKAFQAMEEQVRQNMAMFDKAMRMFTPFPPPGGTPAEGEDAAEAKPAETLAAPENRAEMDALKRQVEEMQRRLDEMSRPAKEASKG